MTTWSDDAILSWLSENDGDETIATVASAISY